MAELPKDTIYHYESKDGMSVTITMTELVRCKDCKWFNDIGCAIHIVDDTDKPKDDDYCSFGERKGEQTDYHIENDGTYETGKGDYE